MNLSTVERVILLSILPSEGKLTDYRILRDTKTKIAFTDEEIAKLGLKEEDGRVVWNGDSSIEFEPGQRAREIIVEALKKLDEEGKVNDQNFILFEKFGVE